jgi:hypothetical protein
MLRNQRSDEMYYAILRWSIIMFTYLVLLLPLLLLSGCGYQEGDLDRGLECIDGCNNGAKAEEEKARDGRDGKDGKDGRSCTVKGAVNGATIFCDDGTNAVLYNGTDGKDAEDVKEPLTRYTITQMVDPCGKQSDYDEILLRLEDGSYLALYYDFKKKMSFLTVIGPGDYITTDNTNCAFSIEEDGRVVW